MTSNYWSTPTGTHVLRLERILLAEHIRRFHGDTVVWAGIEPAAAGCLAHCMVRNPVFFDLRHPGLSGTFQPGTVNGDVPDRSAVPDAPASAARSSEPNGEVGVCYGTLQTLPFKSNSVDGLLLHHGLEFASPAGVSDPRTALREVTRVLAPGGRLIVVGFNPLSFFGVRRIYSRLLSDSLAEHNFVNPIRLFDWLTLLGFELQGAPLYSGHGLPFVSLSEQIDFPSEQSQTPARSWAGPWEWTRSHLLPPRGPFGGLFVVNAIKQSAAGSLDWRAPSRGRRLAPVTYPRVATWDRSDLSKSGD